MEPGGPEFAGGDYVVRYGLRGFRGALAGLVVWTGFACLVAADATSPSIPAAIALAMGETGLLAVCGVEIWRAARREVLFAVHPDGVYFGSGRIKEDVPWELICAVEISRSEPGSADFAPRIPAWASAPSAVAGHRNPARAFDPPTAG